MSLLPVRDVEEFKAAWERLKAIKDANHRDYAFQRFAKLCDFQTSEELFGALPPEHRVGSLSSVVPQDAVFILNWIAIYPGNALPAPAERDMVRNQLWEMVELTFKYTRQTT